MLASQKSGGVRARLMISDGKTAAVAILHQGAVIGDCEEDEDPTEALK